MALSAFADKASPPGEEALQAMLGRAGPLWMSLKDGIQAAHGPLTEEWSYSGQAYGWSFRLKQGKRAVLYMTPCRGHFLASLALGEKACRAAHARGLPASLLKVLDDSPRYAEGRGVRIPVRSRRDLAHVEALVALKVAR